VTTPEDIAGQAAELHRDGIAHFHRGELARAVEKLEAALALAGTRADFAADLGVVQQAAGDLDAAETNLRRAMELAPGNADFTYNLANLLADMDRSDAAEGLYRHAITLDPEFAAAHNNLGNLLKDARRYREAGECYRAAIAADGEYAPARRNLADALEAAGETAEAEAAYGAAIHLRGDAGTRIRDALLLPVIPSSLDQIEAFRERMQSRLENLLDDDLRLTDPPREVGATNFMLAYHGLDDRAIQERIAQVYEKACPDLLYRARHCDQWLAGMEGGPMRIGLVSAFFHEHSIGRLNAGLIEMLPRPEFEVHVFSISRARDAMSARIEAAADRFHALPPDLATAREIIAAAELDCLHYPDIGMEPLTYFLAFSRLAPIQCAGWGHPVTTGIGNMDYFISSRRVEGEGAEAAFSEKLVRFDDFTNCIDNPAQGLDLARDQGGGPLLACPQSLFKFHPDFDPILSRILGENPSARLEIIGGSRDNWTRLLRQRLAGTVAGADDRIRFRERMRREDYLRFLHGADVVLDTPHFCGGVTSFEALAVGTPVVTLPSTHTRGRLSLGIYNQMGYRDCIAADAGDYAGLVSKLLSNRDFAAAARAEIAAGAARIFDNERAIAQHADFFTRASFEG
jgi:predicted O-linked N-acetylglucosamine transferase (SPINDLY family)